MKYHVKHKITGKYLIEFDYMYLVAQGTKEQAVEISEEYASKLVSENCDYEMEEVR